MTGKTDLVDNPRAGREGGVCSIWQAQRTDRSEVRFLFLSNG